MQPDAWKHGFVDPLEVVDRTDLEYEERLRILQEWRAGLAGDSAPEADLQEIDGAIVALEMGARLQGDDSDEMPDGADAQRAR